MSRIAIASVALLIASHAELWREHQLSRPAAGRIGLALGFELRPFLRIQIQRPSLASMRCSPPCSRTSRVWDALCSYRRGHHAAPTTTPRVVSPPAHA